MRRFVKLPSWVKVMFTSRPVVEAQFVAWDPQWITPDDARNTADMLEVLKWQLQTHACVLEKDREAAAMLLQAKSKVRCLLWCIHALVDEGITSIGGVGIDTEMRPL